MAAQHQVLDRVYYDENGVRITPLAVQVHDRFYSTSSIIKVDIFTEKPDRRGPQTWIICGVLLLPFLGIGIVPLSVGIWLWFRQSPVYWLVVETKTNRERLVRARDIQALEPLQTATIMAVRTAQAILNLLNAARANSGKLSAVEATTATGLGAADAQSLLQSLVNSGIATQSHERQRSIALYNFEQIWLQMLKLMKVAPEKSHILSLDDAVRATGLEAHMVELIVNCLIISGLATISKDLRAERLVYKFSQSQS